MLYTYSSSKIIQNQNDEFYEPTVTFVIPCKNEEKSIAKTISKSFDADYPENKIEVIVINDGSTDGTINVLNQLKNDYKNLTVVDWKVNRGKRHGMAEGFRLAKGEIIVQLDSDSYIDPSTFRNLVRPFQNPEIGAVCAHADPENADENLLTKMQAAYYFVSFRILKAAESTFLTVFCCSGCSSAYRKSIILPILDVWLNEKFLGLPITWGDDRALTNRVLKMNYQTIYTDKVQAYTICPNNIRTFLKQQVRWKKGWFVNSLFVSRFIYKRHPFVALTYFFPLIFVTLATPFMATKALIYNPIFAHTSPLFYIIGVFLVACIMVIYYRSVSRENKYWPYVFVWSAINMVVLSFILFYALATIQNRKWGTR
jgi:hyaluronan synthase